MAFIYQSLHLLYEKTFIYAGNGLVWRQRRRYDETTANEIESHLYASGVGTLYVRSGSGSGTEPRRDENVQGIRGELPRPLVPQVTPGWGLGVVPWSWAVVVGFFLHVGKSMLLWVDVLWILLGQFVIGGFCGPATAGPGSR